MKTLKELWKENKSNQPIRAQNTQGVIVIIEGMRPYDEDGGCMATGNPETVFGYIYDGSDKKHWWNFPFSIHSDEREWIEV